MTALDINCRLTNLNIWFCRESVKLNLSIERAFVLKLLAPIFLHKYLFFFTEENILGEFVIKNVHTQRHFIFEYACFIANIQ